MGCTEHAAAGSPPGSGPTGVCPAGRASGTMAAAPHTAFLKVWGALRLPYPRLGLAPNLRVSKRSGRKLGPWKS